MQRERIPTRRCAVYTRKSSEEGLEQDFNSLHAQREACEAFVRSQRSEGWKLVETQYDDGGISGGTMERPALQRLLADIRCGRIDIIVVYKVDRLTRSLADFAKIVELFDAHGVSFVAVTQQFNTTSSMGRLTLNILLSFAQFEREVTGERIRDKIAASKRRGMWMGGVVALGYDVKDRRLVPNDAEAQMVRLIFERYRDLGCVRQLKAELDERGIRSKSRNKAVGGKLHSRGALYHLLRNPVYIGKIRHKRDCHPGLHPPIVDLPLWDAVQAQLDGNGINRPERVRKVIPSPLAGKLFDEVGRRLSPTHAAKGVRRYRYYVSSGLIAGGVESSSTSWRLPACELEAAVATATRDTLHDHSALIDALRSIDVPTDRLQALAMAATDFARAHTGRDDDLIDAVVSRVDLHAEGFTLTIAPARIHADMASPDLSITRSVSVRMKRRGVETRMVIADREAPETIDPALLKAVARARRWVDELISGAVPNAAVIAVREGLTDRYISRLLPLAFLAPDITEAIVAGRQPIELTTQKLTKTDIPVDWQHQAKAFGFA